ncbi:MAG TPA: ABC transporter permease [Acidimicrobiaceae bacterium]|nr:ABC transporter permease [Euryarchaeota archaeon]HAY65001.1 ABC transporter permease [Acidimicrobiaceae bacterium]
MNFLIDAFEPAFMQRALIGGLLAVVATSLVGTWVVVRGLAFLGDALAHGVVPGIALAVLWSFNPLVGAFVAALVMSGLITFVSNRTVMRDDTAIGLLFVGMLALGVLIISKAKSFATDVTAILFGDALGVTRADLRNQFIAAVIVIVLTILLYRPFLALTFNQVKAQTLGMRPKLAQAALLTLISVSIVSSFQAIGTLLVFGLIVAPPATAALLVNRIVLIMLVSVVSGSLAVLFGLLLSFHYGTAGGATIAVICVLQFFVVLGGQSLMQMSRNWRQRNDLEPEVV